MHCINLKSDDPFFNLALEESLLKNKNEEYLILSVNKPSIIIGKHQSGHIEANTKFITKNKIPLIRRISGGGTVYHDHGNLNFSFIRRSESGRQVDFRRYTQPVIDFFRSRGVDVSFEGKNDLKIDGLKISGNAEHVYRNRVLHHGTLLFSSSLEMLHNSLRNDRSCFTSRAVVSNPSPVINLNEKTNIFRDINELISEMMNFFLRNSSDNFLYHLTQAEINQAASLADSKYKTWEWNWAYGPEYTFKNSFEINGIIYSCKLFIKDGIIMNCFIEGSDQLRNSSKKLIGCRHMPGDLSEAFRKENISLTEEEIFNLF